MLLIADHLTYEYNKETNQVVRALDDVSLVINKGDFIGLIGHTGSGKSTLVQHLNGLLKPDKGTIYFNGEDIYDKEYDRKSLRGKVGLVFQYPEHQLFEETVFKDVCFGPRNMGVSRRDTELRAYEALKLVGLEDEYFYQSPFDLSGGQKRRVAIAGVLAMKPEILVLDEPTAGLDPKGRDDLLDMIKRLREKTGLTVVLVSHSMEDMAKYVDRIVVISDGKIRYDDTPRRVFAHHEDLEHIGLRAPEVTYICAQLKANGFDLEDTIVNIDEAKRQILKNLGKGR